MGLRLGSNKYALPKVLPYILKSGFAKFKVHLATDWVCHAHLIPVLCDSPSSGGGGGGPFRSVRSVQISATAHVGHSSGDLVWPERRFLSRIAIKKMSNMVWRPRPDDERNRQGDRSKHGKLFIFTMSYHSIARLHTLCTHIE